jgi:D-xylose transport system substrate-binding protein
MRKSMVGLAAASICALALSACSSSGSTSSTNTSSPSSAASTANASTSAPASAPPGSSAASGGAGITSDGNYKIGLLLPETTTARYETKDKPYFTDALKAACPNCTLSYANANSDASTQQQQAESMLANGVKVLVVDPFDGVAAASIVSAAKAQNVPVIAYDRLIKSPDLAYVVSNDYKQVGILQAQTMVDKLKAANVDPASGGIIMINGATTDNNAGNIKAGALSVIDKSGYKVLSETDTWDPQEAQQWVAGQITKFGHKIIGLYSANDNNGNSAIAALHAAGWSDAEIAKLALTGLDASQQGLQNIVAGLQLMTTYNAFKLEATKAAQAAVYFASGKTPPSNGTVDGHPAFLNPPVAVTIDNIESTVIADDFWKASDICTSQYADACAKAGIK